MFVPTAISLALSFIECRYVWLKVNTNLPIVHKRYDVDQTAFTNKK